MSINETLPGQNCSPKKEGDITRLEGSRNEKLQIEFQLNDFLRYFYQPDLLIVIIFHLECIFPQFRIFFLRLET